MRHESFRSVEQALTKDARVLVVGMGTSALIIGSSQGTPVNCRVPSNYDYRHTEILKLTLVLSSLRDVYRLCTDLETLLSKRRARPSIELSATLGA